MDVPTAEADRDTPQAHQTDYDCVIVGGGLAGGLIALALRILAPDCRFCLIEAGERLGGNHRWSWFASDLPEASAALLAEFPLKTWEAGYEIRFPQYARQLDTGYRSLSSDDFHAALMASLPEGSVQLGTRVAKVDAAGVTLESGARLDARRVIDCRTFASSDKLAGGWQVFLGQHIKCETPHGLTRPVIMDASVDQIAPYGNGGAYRFVYVLPLSEDEVFVEDTYYADEPRMDREALWNRTQGYAQKQGWRGEVIGHETGILPVVTGGDFDAAQEAQRIAGVAVAGTRGGFSHPLTSYTLPFAAENALAIARLLDRKPRTTGAQLAAFCEARARAHWRRTHFYRMLGRMLFEAADPYKRVNVFQHFYQLSGTLVERFYAARSTWGDRIRILSGRPPVAIPRAVRALFSPGTPFETETKA
ncbi:MAG: lycopene beta-cyclase CrtY [Erythrobacter sp.]